MEPAGQQFHQGNRNEIWAPCRDAVEDERVLEAVMHTKRRAVGSLQTWKSIMHYYVSFWDSIDSTQTFVVTEHNILTFLCHVEHVKVPYSTLLHFHSAIELFADCLGFRKESYWTDRVAKIFRGIFYCFFLENYFRIFTNCFSFLHPPPHSTYIPMEIFVF